MNQQDLPYEIECIINKFLYNRLPTDIKLEIINFKGKLKKPILKVFMITSHIPNISSSHSSLFRNIRVIPFVSEFI